MCTIFTQLRLITCEKKELKNLRNYQLGAANFKGEYSYKVAADGNGQQSGLIAEAKM